MDLKKIAYISTACLGIMVASLCFFSQAQAAQEPPYKVGQTVQTIKADLTGDKSCENISLRIFKIDQDNAFAKLVVTDRHGKVLGKSPEIASYKDARAMGCFPWANSNLEMAGQIKGNRPQIFVSVPRTDVRPAVFAIWTWDNSKHTLTYESSQCLLGKDSSNTFYWSKLPQDYGPHARWIDTLANPSGQLKPSHIVGRVFEYNKDASQCKFGRAEFTIENKTLKLNQWLPNENSQK